MHALAVGYYAIGLALDDEIAESKLLARGDPAGALDVGAAPTEHRFYACHEFLGIEWPRDEVVGAKSQAKYPIDRSRARTADDDGNVGYSLQVGTKNESVFIGQLQVEDDQAGLTIGDCLPGRGARADVLDSVPVPTE
jgi:hypothetical protein